MLGKPIKIPGTKVRIPDRSKKNGRVCRSCGRPIIPVPKLTRNGIQLVCPFCGSAA
jgi:predicted RNA-binding Zn-ribbon protein involved in translation (DUF1610 family)